MLRLLANRNKKSYCNKKEEEEKKKMILNFLIKILN